MTSAQAREHAGLRGLADQRRVRADVELGDELLAVGRGQRRLLVALRQQQRQRMT